MRILGISAFYHDSAAALIHDGDIVAAAQEERFTRKKHDAGFPANAVAYCLERGDPTPMTLTTSSSTKSHFSNSSGCWRPIWPSRRVACGRFRWLFRCGSGRSCFKERSPDKLRSIDGAAIRPERLLFTEHHLSHAASAFFPSPFEEAAVLTMDGVGEWATTSVAIGRGNHLEVLREIHFPHSLGLLYSAFTYYTGFRVNSGEYKLMGLAPYGEPSYAAPHPATT